MTSQTPEPTDQNCAEAKAAFEATLHSVGANLDSDLRSRATILSANSAAISKQEDQLARNTAALEKKSNEYQKIADQSRQKLKEIGDIQNWAEMIERDLLVVEETLRQTEEEEEEEEQTAAGGGADAGGGSNSEREPNGRSGMAIAPKTMAAILIPPTPRLESSLLAAALFEAAAVALPLNTAKEMLPEEVCIVAPLVGVAVCAGE
ncbi:MAG: hypothetical protein M1834_006920 [Cirrosporium novae-zelandiae]|nr:MAG: hypothetical protein M1834_006920 [Cirrosporium novae-zelandiae]